MSKPDEIDPRTREALEAVGVDPDNTQPLPPDMVSKSPTGPSGLAGFLTGQVIRPEAIDSDVLENLQGTIERIISAAPADSSEVRSVYFGTSRQLSEEEHGGSVTVTRYQPAGNAEYARTLHERYGVDILGTNVQSYVGLSAESASLQTEVDTFFLNDGRGLTVLKLRAGSIAELRTDESIRVYNFMKQFGFADAWYEFEHRAYAREAEPASKPQSYSEEFTVWASNDTAASLDKGLEAFLRM